LEADSTRDVDRALAGSAKDNHQQPDSFRQSTRSSPQWSLHRNHAMTWFSLIGVTMIGKIVQNERGHYPGALDLAVGN
jgi:hypothetical protein